MRWLYTIVPIGAVLAGALIASGGESVAVNRDLLPPIRPSVADVHQLHAKGEADCKVCHPRVATSRWASDRLVPQMEQCAACHEEARDVTPLTPVTDECRKCHRDLKSGEKPLPGTYPRPNVRFSHVAHVDRECATCHPRAGAGLPSGPARDVVGMRTCYGCHAKEPAASTECRTCHLIHKDGRMVTHLGASVLTPPRWLGGPTHGVQWAQSHAVEAGADSRFCGTCHRETFCQNCHSGRLRPRDVHPGDWIASHGVTSRIDNPSCRGCHHKQTFCVTCHRRAGVAPDSPAATRPHGAGRYHGELSVRQLCRRAKHDIVSCVSCHSESSCISCHAAINPHPPGWERRCKPLVRRNSRACAKCHKSNVTKRCQ